MGVQEKYLKERIKVDGKAGNLGDKVTVSKDKSKIVVQVCHPLDLAVHVHIRI